MSLMELYMLPMAQTCYLQRRQHLPTRKCPNSRIEVIDGVVYPNWGAAFTLAAISPDLDPIANLSTILSRRIHANYKCYGTLSALKKAIQLQWHEIDLNGLQMLVSEMHNRCNGVVQPHYGPLKYWRLFPVMILMFLLFVIKILHH